MKPQEVITKLDELIGLANELDEKKVSTRMETLVDYELFVSFKTQSLSFIIKLLGNDHIYVKEFRQRVVRRDLSDVEAGRAILNGVKNEVNGGWLNTTRELISAEIFSDFLEMAEYLLKEDYKDAAAVIIGSVLEEHLRNLCTKHGVPIEVQKGTDIIHKKAEAMNTDLYKTGIYNLLYQKSITSYLDLRNNAAHGKYSEYNIENVRNMYQGILTFISAIK